MPYMTAPAMERLVRDEDLHRLDALLTTHKVGVITGDLGLGTSLLLRRLESRSTGPIIRIPNHRCEASTPGSGLDIGLASMRSLDAKQFMAEFWDPNATELDMATTILDALRSAEIPDGTLIIVPGADEMDTTSQVILGHVLRRMSDHRLRIVISARPITEESPFAGIPHLDLHPLGREELIQLAHRATAQHLSPASARIAARAASGRPHALGLILNDMSESQQSGRFALTVPVRLGSEAAAMAREILGELDNDLEHILKRRSLAPLTSLRTLQREVPELSTCLADLEARGVVERRGPFLLIADEFVRAAVHGSMGASEHIALHQRLCAASAPHHAGMGRWHRSFSTVDEGTASSLATEGLGFITSGLVDAGIEFIERSITLSADVSAAEMGLTNIAEALYARGEFAFAARYTQFARESHDHAVSVRARAIELQLDYVQTQSLPTRLISNWSRGELAAAPREVAGLQLMLGQLHCERRELAEACELLKEAERLEAHFGSREQNLCDGLRMSVAAARGDDRLTLAKFAELSALNTDELSAEYLLTMASALMMTEHYEPAQACLDLLHHHCGDASTWVTQARYLQAEIAIRAGQIGHALGLIESFPDGPHTDWTIRRDRLLLLQCWHLITSGRASDAHTKEAELAAYATKTRNSSLSAELNALQGNYLLQVGLPAEAARHLQRGDERCLAEPNPNLYRHEPDLIEALIRLGRREHAAMLLKRLRSRTERCPSRWAEGAVRRCEALLASGQKSIDLFHAALRAHPESLFAQALIHTAFAERLAELGATSHARDQTLIAASLYEEIGAQPPTARDLSAPQQAPEQSETTRPELTGLSEEERMVVEMVQAGLKNREIATRIYVSLRTVELRLTAVYRKLGVSSRTELMAQLAGAPRLAAA